LVHFIQDVAVKDPRTLTGDVRDGVGREEPLLAEEPLAGLKHESDDAATGINDQVRNVRDQLTGRCRAHGEPDILTSPWHAIPSRPYYHFRGGDLSSPSARRHLVDG